MKSEPRVERPAAAQARDVMVFGQEYGRILSDGRIVGRAEPFAKVFPSSRAVKRAVGLVAWAVLEDIALDARLDDEGRLVADTNVRRMAANLGLSKNTVVEHLRTLREYGFVFHEERRCDATGRYGSSRYVLDPSACIERFTVTPAARDGWSSRLSQQADAASGAPDTPPGPTATNATEGSTPPCPTSWDTVPVSHVTGHREVGHTREVVVGGDVLQQQQRGDDEQPEAGVAVAPIDGVELLRGLGVDPPVAAALAAAHPLDAIAAAVAAVPATTRNAAGWVVAALRGGWDCTTRAKQPPSDRERFAVDEARDDERRRAEAARRADEDRWASLVSSALADEDLDAALCAVTSPVAPLGRRTASVASAQLLWWAAAVDAHAAPADDLRSVLTRALANPDETSRGPLEGCGPPAHRLATAHHAVGARAALKRRVAARLPSIDRLPTPAAQTGRSPT